MGGQSFADFVIEDGALKFTGEVVDVPSLQAPGFVKVATSDRDVGFPDISSCTSLGLTVRATDNYDGYRLAFGNARPPAGTGGGFFTSGHKSIFFVNESTTVQVPLNQFSSAWNDGTGDIETECADDERVCPTEAILQDIGNIQLWGEGRGGVVNLEVERIFASGCAEAKIQPRRLQNFPTLGENLCTGDIQENLAFNLSVVGVDAVYDLPYPVAPGATLAEAICCDQAFEPFAEPRELYARGDVNLFAEMKKIMAETGLPYVTFYDSVCGLPLYRAPVGRTFEEFEEDTIEHFWPSFRKEEIFYENIGPIREGTDYLFSTCGTHLGSDLPEESPWGVERHCIDLTCIAGSPLKMA